MFALGLGDQLVGVSDLCDYPPAARHKPVISRSRIDTTVLSSAEVEATMRALLAAGESPFHIDATMLQQAQPDLVLTQDTCAICDATAADVQRALDGVRPPPAVLILSPAPSRRFLTASWQLGKLPGRWSRAHALVAALAAACMPWPRQPRGRTTDHGCCRSKASHPLVAGGHWIPELKTLAGGRDGLFSPGCAAQRLAWTTIRDTTRRFLVITPCSSGLERSLRELHSLAAQDGWWRSPGGAEA